jgi:transcriptional regulator GlxA family with amidase domain
MIDVTVLLLSNNYVSTSFGPIEVFHAAGFLWNVIQGAEIEPRFRVTTASLDGESITSPYGVVLTPQASVQQIKSTDIVIVPSSGVEIDAQLQRHAALMPWLRERHQAGAYVASVCSGAVFLAEAGLLDGRQATTHWAVANELQRRYPRVNWRPDMFITEDNGVLCSAGVCASIDLGMYLVDKLCGHDIAVQCAKSLLVDMPRSHQSGYAVLPLSRQHNDKRIRAIEAYIDENFAKSLSVEALAARANMSTRNFIRRFKAATGHLPGNYLQSRRITVAKEMLERGGHSVKNITLAVGYADAASFRAVFKRYTGMSPIEYRRKFGRRMEAA